MCAGPSLLHLFASHESIFSSSITAHIHNRPRIVPPPPNEVINDTEQHHRPGNQRRVIHRRRRRRIRRRPEAEEPEHEHVRAREDIVRHAQETRHPPRAPDQAEFPAARVHGRGGEDAAAGGRGLDGACAAAPEEETRGCEVGCVEAGDGEREHIVEYGRGAEVDEG